MKGLSQIILTVINLLSSVLAENRKEKVIALDIILIGTYFLYFLVNEYYSMPSLFQVDPYDECFADEIKYSPNVYCIVEVFVQPNQSNDIWRSIVKFSHPWRSRCRHDHLVYGVCINRCRQTLENLKSTTSNQFYTEISENFAGPFIEQSAFNNALEDALEFSDEINQCINYELTHNFNLTAHVMVQYCKVKGRDRKIGNQRNFAMFMSFSVLCRFRRSL